ncbi:MAG: hypothetical protein IPH17_05610 [Bacteroidales bacterium]|nr:hypothetical protein [Bacteroidales bacterium]
MNNIIHSVKYTGTSGYGGHGIESYYSNNALIANNMIYDMQGDGYTSITGSSMAGIVIRYSNENKVYFNSVNLFGDYTRSNATITSAFFADANSSELDVRNNIFANQGVLGYFNSTDQISLASLRAATGKDVHSINVDPEFTSNTDLHTSNSDLSSMGTYTRH